MNPWHLWAAGTDFWQVSNRRGTPWAASVSRAWCGDWVTGSLQPLTLWLWWYLCPTDDHCCFVQYFGIFVPNSPRSSVASLQSLVPGGDLGACLSLFCFSFNLKYPHVVVAVNPDRFSVPSFMFTDFVSITWDLLFSVFEAVDAATRSHLVGDFGHLRCLLCSPTAVSESWLCFQGDCKDLGRVKVTETSLSPLLLCRYSLLESSSVFFRKHWGLNAIYSRYIRSQMLIFLWHIPEAFVLTEEINAAPGKCGSLLLCGHAPHQPGGSQELCWFLAQFSCWNWILKLGTEWRIPLSNLKCLHCYLLRETWRAAESVLCKVYHYF